MDCSLPGSSVHGIFQVIVLAAASVISDSVRPHRRQPNRLLCPWDSPGKNTGVCCHFLLHCIKVKNESEVAQSCPTLSGSMDWSGLPFPSSGDLPDTEIKPRSPALEADALPSEPPGKPIIKILCNSDRM